MNRTKQTSTNSFLDVVLRLLSSFIILASLLVLPKVNAAVGDTFMIDHLKYTVLTEEPASQTGTVSVQAESKEISGDIAIPASVVNGGLIYSVTLIPANAFYECGSLASIVIPESVTSIKGRAFSGCSNLNSIIIPESVTAIEDYLFSGCIRLTNATIPESVTSIGPGVFYQCSGLTNIIIPDSVTSIGASVFRDCNSLTNIIIPDSVAIIPDYTFYNCSSLTDIVIPNNISSIGRSAFYNCGNLITVRIGNNVASIADYAFYECISLTGIYFEGNAPGSVGGNVFSRYTVIYYRANTTGWTNSWNGRPTDIWIDPPTITEQPLSQDVMEGASVTFSVVAEGTVPLSYQWYKEGVAIENAVNASYTIESVTPEDSGNYTVVVSNGKTETTSNVATLTLRIPYRATGTVQVANGYVVGLSVIDGGWGYTRAPNIRIIDESGKGATGHCVIENGVVTQIIIDSNGSNYSGEATILIGSPVSNKNLKIGVAEVKVKMRLILGMEYQLWSSDDYSNWKKVGEPFKAKEEEMTFFFTVADYGRFFKLQEI